MSIWRVLRRIVNKSIYSEVEKLRKEIGGRRRVVRKQMLYERE
jgi:hypothetical protein